MNEILTEFNKLIELKMKAVSDDIKGVEWHINLWPDGAGEVAGSYFHCGEEGHLFFINFDSPGDLLEALKYHCDKLSTLP